MNVNTTGGVNRQDEVTIDLSRVFNQLLVHKWLVIIITSVFLMIGVFYSYLKAPQYKSEVLIQIDDKNSSSKFSAAAALGSFGFSNQNNASAVISALIKSRFILSPVIHSLGLDISLKPKQSFWNLFSSTVPPKAQIKAFNVPKLQFNEPFDLFYEGNSTISLFKNKSLILKGKIGTELTDAAKKFILNVESVDALPGTHFTLTKYPETKILAQLTENVNIAALGDKNKDTGLLSISLRGTDPYLITRILNEATYVAQTKNAEKKSLEASQILNFLLKQLPLAKESLDDSERKLNQYRGQSGKIDIKFQAKLLLDQFSELDKQLATLRISEIEMAEKYTVKHPSLMALNGQMKEIEGEKGLLEKRIKSLPESDQIALGLMREVKVKSALYTSLLKRIQELEVLKAGTVSDVQILSLATPPDEMQSGKSILNYLASILLGLMTSVVLIFGRSFIFPKVQDPYWSEQHFEIANLAVIPFSKEQGDAPKSLNTSSKNQSILMAEANPRNLSVEALRSLRTSLQLNLVNANNNIISILGVSPAIGKSFVTANLAYLLASTGKKTLLIDADLRRGTIHKYFNLEATQGFSELIQNKIPNHKALKKTTQEYLTVLTRGQYPADPAELLTGDRCKELIALFSKEYDVILFDTPPIRLVTDGLLISAASALNYLVIGANMHSPEDIEITIKQLRASRINISGTIFNCPNALAQSSMNQSHNQYYYYEDDEQTKQGFINKVRKMVKNN